MHWEYFLYGVGTVKGVEMNNQDEKEFRQRMSALDSKEQQMVAESLPLDLLLNESYVRLMTLAQTIRITVDGRKEG